MTTQDFRDGETCLEFGHEPQRLDILQKISGVTFEDAWKDRVAATIDGDIPISVISSKHLIQNKRAAGRPRDLLDVEEIEKAASHAPSVATNTKPVLKKRSKEPGR
jgi:hypothetical protein